MEIKLEIVTADQAYKLKSLGFNLPAEYYYMGKETEALNKYTNINSQLTKFQASAPTVALVLKWLRKTYGIYSSIFVRHMKNGSFGFSINHNMYAIPTNYHGSIVLFDYLNSDISKNEFTDNDGVIDDYDLQNQKFFHFHLILLLNVT